MYKCTYTYIHGDRQTRINRRCGRFAIGFWLTLRSKQYVNADFLTCVPCASGGVLVLASSRLSVGTAAARCSWKIGKVSVRLPKAHSNENRISYRRTSGERATHVDFRSTKYANCANAIDIPTKHLGLHFILTHLKIEFPSTQNVMSLGAQLFNVLRYVDRTRSAANEYQMKQHTFRSRRRKMKNRKLNRERG